MSFPWQESAVKICSRWFQLIQGHTGKQKMCSGLVMQEPYYQFFFRRISPTKYFARRLVCLWVVKLLKIRLWSHSWQVCGTKAMLLNHSWVTWPLSGLMRHLIDQLLYFVRPLINTWVPWLSLLFWTWYRPGRLPETVSGVFYEMR